MSSTAVLILALCVCANAACSNVSLPGGDPDGSADADADTDSDSDSDSDGDPEYACNEQSPKTIGDCESGEEVAPVETEIVEIAELWFDYYTGPSTPEAAAEVEHWSEGFNKVFVFSGQTGWDDFVSTCLSGNLYISESDFPQVDFESQKVVYFEAAYEFDCTYDGHGQSETRAGDLSDGSVRVNGYFYNTGTSYDCDLEGIVLSGRWIVVLDTTEKVGACLRLAQEPPA